VRTHLLIGWMDDAARAALAHGLARTDPGGRVRWTDGPELPPDAAAVRTLVTGRPTAESLDACSSLEAIVVPFAGLPKGLPALAAARPALRVHNLHHNAAPTAQMAVALLLAAATRIVPCDRALRADDWTPRYAEEPSVTLAGRSACVLGYGAIGRRVAHALRGLGMDVRAVRRTAAGPGVARAAGDSGEAAADGIEVIVAADGDAVRSATRGCHAIVVCLPRTPETEGLVDAAMLDGLAAPALVVNVGRGEIVDETALHARLVDGRIFGAGLDTWWRYPEDEAARPRTPPSALAYGELDSVVLSPHRGGTERIEDERPRRMEALAELLAALARGAHETGRVDPARGY
jgi:phosphoglycerate dehydrogenase-like enzyme